MLLFRLDGVLLLRLADAQLLPSLWVGRAEDSAHYLPAFVFAPFVHFCGNQQVMRSVVPEPNRQSGIR